MNNSLNSTSPCPSTAGEPKTKLRHCFRFTFRTWLVVILLAALAGLATHAVLRVVVEDQMVRELQGSFYRARQMANGRQKYQEMVREWYDEVAEDGFVSHDALDLIMRKAVRLDTDQYLAGLERISSARREGDTILVFAVDAPPVAGEVELSASSHRYAFLVRNDRVVFSAERAPDDTRWVERSMYYAEYATDSEGWLSGAVILGSMLLVLIAAAGLLILVAFFRYLRAYFAAPQMASFPVNKNRL